jgi:hypothetical protein
MARANRKSVIVRILEFRNARKTKDALEKEIKDAQPTLIGLLKEIDPNNQGVVYTDSDPDGKSAAFVQQNDAQQFWDVEAIIDYLKQDRALWMSCSSRSLDLKKFESEIANGNIPKNVARKFRETGDAPAPFIAFRKPTENSK